MATTIGQHSVASFTSPVNGTTPIDANTVRGNDNTLRVAYVDHDADPGIHVQSSTLASRPAAGTAGRKWITSDYPQKLWYDDGTDWHEVGGDAITVYCKATETIAKGDVVKVTGWNNGQSVAEIAKVSSATDTAFGVAEAAIANGSLGYVVNTGILTDVATNSFSLGDILYPNTSGGFTATKPTSGTYQPCAYVLRSNATNGVLYVEFSASRIVESSSNTASTVVLRDASGNFSAGTITATTLAGTLSTAAQPNVTSVGTLTSLTVSGDLTVRTDKLKVTSSGVGIGTTTPGTALQVNGEVNATGTSGIITVNDRSTTGTGGMYRTAGTTRLWDASYGDVLTWDASGNVAVDTNTLYVDAANNRVGVGTASPEAQFVVSTSTAGGEGGYIYIDNPSVSTLGSKAGIKFSTSSGGSFASVPTGEITNVVTDAGNGASAITFGTYNGSASGERMRLDASGNLGLGVTPSAWVAGARAVQLDSYSSLFESVGGKTILSFNAYESASNTYKYLQNEYATMYQQVSGIHSWYTAPSGTAGNAITFTQAMTLDASGNLGVGTASPSYRITAVVANSGTFQNALVVSNAANSELGIRLKTDVAELSNSGSSGVIAFATGASATERARITSGGYFKASDAGTYYGSTGAYHEIRQSTNDLSLVLSNSGSGAVEGILLKYSVATPNNTGSAFIFCADATATRAVIRSNGGLANYQSNNVDLSDARTKTDITPATSMWGKIGALEIVTYKYVDQTHDDVNVGVIAQQVEAVEPVWVDSDGWDKEVPEGEEPLKTVYTKDITFAAIKALQEAMARIEALEVEVAALKAGA